MQELDHEDAPAAVAAAAGRSLVADAGN